MDQMELIGFSAMLLSSSSVLPQAVKIYRTRNAEHVSTMTFLTLGLGNLLWNVYSLHNAIMPMFISSTFFMCFTFAVLALKFHIWAENKFPDNDVVTQDITLMFNGFSQKLLAVR